MTMTRSANHRFTDSATAMSARCHGSLDEITDTERRALRPIGTTTREVAARTDVLLADLLALPGVRIFRGVLPAAAGMPRIPHAISAGHQLLFVESVAWPPGRYHVVAGRIHCDGLYTGQSVRPLIGTVRRWRESLPPGHRVGAMVVVHPTAEGDLALPAATARVVAWTRAGDAVPDIRGRLSRRRQPASIRAVAALLAATAAEENR
jgi:hypothetical protein